MRLNKIVASIALVSLATAIAAAQSATISIHLSRYTGDFGSVTQVTENPATAPNQLTFDLSDFGGSNTLPVKVTVRVRGTHNTQVARGFEIINSWVDLRGTGLTVAEFQEDEAGNDNDDRKNANSHPRGNGTIDGAGNGVYRNNSARWYQPNAPGDPLPGPAAFGKSIYTTPFTGTTSIALYSFVVLVPRQVGTYNVNFGRVLSGMPANTDPTVKTNILANTPDGRPFQYALEAINGQINVVPEPASMIALGSGLVGLLALRRRRAN